MFRAVNNKILILGIAILGIIICSSSIFSKNIQEEMPSVLCKISDSHVNSIKCKYSISKFQFGSIFYLSENEHFSVNLKPILRFLKAIYKEMTKFRRKLGLEFPRELINNNICPRFFTSNFNLAIYTTRHVNYV